jgi:hypothetical protein
MAMHSEVNHLSHMCTGDKQAAIKVRCEFLRTIFFIAPLLLGLKANSVSQ